MLHNEQKVICHTLIVAVAAVAIMMLGFTFCSYSAHAFTFQPAIHHRDKVFDKKQADGTNSHDGSSSSSSDTKRSDNSNDKGNNNNNKNNNQDTNDGSNTGADNNLQTVEPAKTDEQQQQQGTEESIAPSLTATPTPTPQTTCEQGSNCTDQQGLSDHDRSTADVTTKQDDNTPFVLSLPFP